MCLNALYEITCSLRGYKLTWLIRYAGLNCFATAEKPGKLPRHLHKVHPRQNRFPTRLKKESHSLLRRRGEDVYIYIYIYIRSYLYVPLVRYVFLEKRGKRRIEAVLNPVFKNSLPRPIYLRRRNQVEERKRLICEAERERREAILRKNQEREARIEAKKKNERSHIVFAFGSSTPRMLEPADTGGSTFWGTRRATSTTNVMMFSAAQPLTRRSSERELDGSKKRATSAGGLDRKPGEG